MRIEILTEKDIRTHAKALVEILRKTVADDGAVGFVMPLSQEDATRFWAEIIAAEVKSGARIMFGAFEGAELTGTGQLIVGMPNNQPHRAEIAKLMVHPNHRRKGIARKLMHRLEQCAHEHGRSLITLDTRTGDGAEPLYTTLGFKTAGIIPRYGKNAVTQGFHATTYMYKEI